jgi:putative FmdB family regulatory protein
MPLYDYECPEHGEFEEFKGLNNVLIPCPICGKQSKRLVTIGRLGVSLANEDAKHIRESAAALLDINTAKTSDKTHVRNLALNPTRTNLKRYLKAEKIRYAEPERGAPPVYKRPPEPDTRKITEQMAKNLQERRRIEVNSR